MLAYLFLAYKIILLNKLNDNTNFTLSILNRNNENINIFKPKIYRKKIKWTINDSFNHNSKFNLFNKQSRIYLKEILKRNGK